MTEIFFVLTIIYAAYVVYSVVSDNKKSKVIDDSAPALMSVVNVPVKPLIPEKVMTQPLVKPVANKNPKSATTKAGLKNPETGEIAPSYANYRFMKPWIKEALVAEGLLEKIYKNNELNPEIEVQIKEAVARLENVARYRI
ncbi:MAG: hypothetical protein PHN45_11550 [Methylococcales bacterium]|nr:hypothetical protein [Methylococcales bacterium]MDD5755369.1 hypothetical protein [Methylococcales bacterium]